MTVQIDMGRCVQDEVAVLDLEELLATRLLVQGNSGSGKSYLLRRLLEQSAPWVQQVIIDPEGDFVTLTERFGHLAINVEAGGHTETSLLAAAEQVRQHRVSAVLNLENLDAEEQMRLAAAFLNGLFDADRAFWYAALVIVDEAQLFAPAVGGEVSDEARKASLGAMTNLMCRGRKRGLAGVIATQRLAKLAKNVAAEASNFLMGRTFLDIDMARAADLLGLDRRQAEMFRDLPRGNFIALGPALSRRPTPIRIGAVETAARGTTPKLTPLPGQASDAVLEQILRKPEGLDVPRMARRSASHAPDMVSQLAEFAKARESQAASEQAAQDGSVSQDAAARSRRFEQIVREMVAEPEAALRPGSVLYHDFTVRCRIHGLTKPLDLAAFQHILAVARSGISAEVAASEPWQDIKARAALLPDDAQAVFLLMARAALERLPCPSDAAVARAYGTASLGRARRVVAYLEEQGMIVCQQGRGGNRTIALTGLAWETAPGNANAAEAA